MLKDYQVNPNSLKIINEEMTATLEKASGMFEGFLANKEDTGLLEQCIASLQQCVGAFQIVELPACTQFTQEIIASLQKVLADGEATKAPVFESLSDGIVALPRYFEYVQNKKHPLPIIVAPYINALRQARREPLISERDYAEVTMDISVTFSKEVASPLEGDELQDMARRMRHMYQVGLLGVVRDEHVPLKLRLMHRAVERILSYCGDKPIGDMLVLTGAVLEGFIDQGDVSVQRKRLLSAIDRQLKDLVNKTDEALAKTLDDDTKAEMLFLIALAQNKGDLSQKVLTEASIPQPNITDAEIQAERKVMKGPSGSTVEIMVNVIKEELRSAKDILEIASQQMGTGLTDYKKLLENLSRVADTLLVVGLNNPSAALKEQIVRIQQWEAAGDTPEKELYEVADSLLFLESSLSNLKRLDLANVEGGAEQAMALSLLDEAQQIVIGEAQGSIAATKRAITSYIESNMDASHMASIAGALDQVRGGMQLMGMDRITKVLSAAVSFVNSVQQDDFDKEKAPQKLETFADALISMEYYFIGIEPGSAGDQSILELAEESLASLGFAVT